MSRQDFDEFVAHATLHFEEGLIQAGFRDEDGRWRGPVARGENAVEVHVNIPPGFPFVPPRLRPVDESAVPWSWHRELDGSLCLVAEDDHQGLWWREAPSLLEHAAAWFGAADSGWPDDRPDLDIERYFPASNDKRLYMLPELERFADSFVRFRRSVNGTMELASRMQKPAPMRKKFQFDGYGYVARLRVLDVPPRRWEDVAGMTEAQIDLGQAIRDRRVDLLVLCYKRGVHQGAIVLDTEVDATGRIDLRRLSSASTGPSSRLIRSGPYAPLLAEKRIAVVGLGAVGSHVADMLARAGVRKLALLDDDILKPGNVVRHLLGSAAVGLRKADGVANELVSRYGITRDDLNVRGDLALTDQTAYELLASHDLVINATAEYAVTALLHAAARADDRHFVSVAIQNHGDTLRIDILPPLRGEPLPRSDHPDSRPTVENFEASCGSPISPTPPFAVAEAAAITVRHAVGLLVDRPLHPSGEVRHMGGAAE